MVNQKVVSLKDGATVPLGKEYNMDVLNKIERLIKEDLQDEYDSLKKQLQAAKARKASQSTLDLIRSKMSSLRVRIVKGQD